MSNKTNNIIRGVILLVLALFGKQPKKKTTIERERAHGMPETKQREAGEPQAYASYVEDSPASVAKFMACQERVLNDNE